MEREKSENESIAVDCGAALDIMVSAAYGDADDESMRLLREHLAECESCRAEFEKIKRLPGLVAECRVLPERDLVGSVMARVKVEAAAKRRRRIVSRCAVAASFMLCATLIFAGYKMLVGSANKQYEAPSDLYARDTGSSGILCAIGINSADDVASVRIGDGDGEFDVADREFVSRLISALSNMKSGDASDSQDGLPGNKHWGIGDGMGTGFGTESVPENPDTSLVCDPDSTTDPSDAVPPSNIFAPPAPSLKKIVITLRDGTSVEADCDADLATVTIDGTVYDASALTSEELEIIFGNTQK